MQREEVQARRDYLHKKLGVQSTEPGSLLSAVREKENKTKRGIQSLPSKKLKGFFTADY